MNCEKSGKTLIKPIAYLLLSITYLLASAYPISAETGQSYVNRFLVIAVIDGDTIEIEGNRKIRYLGIDTPEIGEPFYEEAKNKNRELVSGKTVRLEICNAEHTDNYGRLLAYVYVGQTMVNMEILKAGYARIFILPPCGTEKEKEFRQYQKDAMKQGLGLWGKRKKAMTKDFVPASDAARFIDERRAIHGIVTNAHEGRNAIFLEIGSRLNAGLRAVIFNQDKRNFEDDGIDPLTHYRGKEVIIYGKIKMYRGMPEVIVGSPSQIEIW